MEQLWNRCRKKVQIIALSVFLLGLLLLVAVISWNTKNAAAGGSFMIGKGSYLIFDHSWGSNRGFTWKTTAKIFAEMPFLNQLLGAGPDCYYPYSYTVSAYAQTLHDFWKPDILTNAHNEFLNLLICLGGFGLLSWLILLFGSGWRFVQAGRKNLIVFAGTLTICAYAAHNFFCYQQVCCTPFLFLILGFAENLARDTDSFS
jgi:O-antigen ligase